MCIYIKKTCMLIIDVYSIQTDTMNEMNAKREARRRKILENSENRLHKIGARYNLDETKGKLNKLIK